MKYNLFFAFILLLGIVSCGSKEPIVGKWKLVEIDYSEHLKSLDPEVQEIFLSMVDRQSQNILNKTFFDFEDDGSLVITAPKFDKGSTADEGTWRLNTDKDSLFITNSDSEIFALRMGDENTMLLSSVDQPMRRLKLVRE